MSPPVLKSYNPLLAIKVSRDASEKYLGAVLEQRKNELWHPIAYTSRTLNKSWQNYCQLEKETLLFVFFLY